MARKTKGWSYNAGERGANWVRAYADCRDGRLYAEFFDNVEDAASGETVRKKRRISLSAAGVTTTAEAVAKVEKMAAEFAALSTPEGRPAPLTLRELVTLYGREETPKKGKSKQDHDRRAARLFLAFFDSRKDRRRRSDRAPGSLDKKDWDEFIADRRAGRIAGFDPVRDRVIEYDLKLLIAVLSWAEGADEHQAHHLTKNPWGG